MNRERIGSDPPRRCKPNPSKPRPHHFPPFASSASADSPSASFLMAARHSASGRDPYDTRMCPGAPNALE